MAYSRGIIYQSAQVVVICSPPANKRYFCRGLAIFEPRDTHQLQLKIVRAQRFAQVLTIFFDGVGRCVAPPERRNGSMSAHASSNSGIVD